MECSVLVALGQGHHGWRSAAGKACCSGFFGLPHLAFGEEVFLLLAKCLQMTSWWKKEAEQASQAGEERISVTGKHGGLCWKGEEPCGVCPAQPMLPAAFVTLRRRRACVAFWVQVGSHLGRGPDASAAARGPSGPAQRHLPGPTATAVQRGTSSGWPVTKCAPRSSRQQLSSLMA